MRKKALEDIMDQEYENLPSYDMLLDRLKIAVFPGCTGRKRTAGGEETVRFSGSDLRMWKYRGYHGADPGDRQSL